MVNELNELKAKQHQSHNAADKKETAEKIDSLRQSLNELGLTPDREGLSERAIYLEVGPEGVMKLIEVAAEVQDADNPDMPNKLDELTKELGIEEAIFDVAKLKLAIKDIKRLVPFMAARCVKLQRKKRLTDTEKDEYSVLCANLIRKGINPNEADAVQWALIAHNKRTVQHTLDSIDKKRRSMRTPRFSTATYRDGGATNEPKVSTHKGTKPPRDCQLVVRGKKHKEAEMPVDLQYLGIGITSPDELRRILKALEKQQKKLDTERHSAPPFEYSDNEAANLTRKERRLIERNPDWIAIALGEVPDGNVAAKNLTRDQIGLMYHNPDWRRIAGSEAIRKKAEAIREEEAVG